MASPVHLHSLKKAIPPRAWEIIRQKIEELENFLQDNQGLSVNLPPGSSHKTGNKIQFGLGGELFTVERKWPKSWYGTAQLRTGSDSSAIFDLLQRASLLIISHYARLFSVEFAIATQGSIDGWRLADKLASQATSDGVFERAGYLNTLMETRLLVPSDANGEAAPWADVSVDQRLFDIADFALESPGRPTVTQSPLVWRNEAPWFF